MLGGPSRENNILALLTQGLALKKSVKVNIQYADNTGREGGRK
jgi:hypothetical protein